MSSARFLLEFEATGDQEVVNAIKEVGTAGKETAADLDALKNIEDPFSSLSEGADSAIGPIQEVGSAASETVSPLEDMGSATEELGGIFGEAGTSTADFTANMDAVGGAADATVGGLTDANKVVEDFGGAATTAGSSATDFGSSVTNITGGVAALGGIIGSTVSALFRYQDIQLKVQKAQLAAARAAETYRKSEASLNALLKTATSNAAGIAAARQRLAEAQARVNELMDQGVTSGAEWEAAQTELTAAQAALSAEFAKGGGNVAKLTTEMNKNEIAAGKNATATNNLEKVNRQANQGVLDLVFGFVSLTGTLVQTIGSLGKSAAAVKSLATAFKALIPAMSGVASAAATVGIGFAALTGIMTAIQVDAGGVKTKMTEIHDAANKAIPALTPMFDHMGKSFHSNVEGMGDIGRQFTDLLGITIPKSVDVAKKKTEELGTSTKTAGTAMASTIDYTKGFNSILQTSASTVTTAEGVVAKLGGSFVTLGTNLKDLGNGYSTVNGVIVKNSDILNQQGLSVEKVAKAYPAWAEGIKAAGTASAGMRAELEAEGGAILATVGALEASQQALTDAIAVKNDAIASSNALHTALNAEATALIKEGQALEAASASADNLVLQQMRVDNAFKSGVVSIKEWVNGLAEAKAEQQGQSAQLAAMGARWSDIPPFVERNIETLKLFGVAAKQGGAAAAEAAGMAADAWRNATSEMGSELENLAGILMEGGEKMKESTAEWFTGMSQNIGREMTGAEEALSMGIGNMIAGSEQAINDWQFGQLLGESIAQSGSDLVAAFSSLAASAEGGMKDVFSRAAAIVRSDSSLASAVNEVMAGVGKTSPQALLSELNAILPPGLKDSATKAGEGVKGALDPSAAAAGQSAAITLSQEFAAAGTHIATVISGMGSNMSGLEQTARTAGQNAAVALSEGFAAAGTHIATVLKGVAANISKVMGAARAGTGTGLRIPIIVDTKAAIANINKLKTTIAGIKQARPVPIALNISPAVQAANKIRSIVNALPNIKRTITYTYRVVGSRPNPPNLNRTITYRYRTVGSRPAQTGMHENLSEDTMIAAHKGERVDITPNTINTNEERVALVPAGGRRGGGAEYVIPVTLMLDNKVLVRTVSRGLMEDVGGVS